LIDDEGHARICDFGLVRIASGLRGTGWTTTTSHTGTVRYAAYEFVNPDEDHIVSTKEGDIYSIGCLGLEVNDLAFKPSTLPIDLYLTSNSRVY
jgi:serine/threonine protein kinase